MPPLIEQWFDAGLLLLLVTLSAVAAGRRLVQAKPIAWTLVARDGLVFLAVLAVRTLVVKPTFLHVNFRGYTLVDQILSFPEPALSLGATYGQMSFLALGFIARVLHGGVRTILGVNQIAAASMLLFLGKTVARWTDRREAVYLALIVGALHPGLARVAASEDAHSLALLFGWVALFFIDVYAKEENGMALLVATLSALAMVGTRQTLYLWAPGIYLMAIGRGGFRLLRRPGFLGSGILVAALLFVRVFWTLRREPVEVTMLFPIYGAPFLWPPLLKHHFLFDLSRFSLLLLPLTVVGTLALARRSAASWTFGAFFAAYFLFTFPFGFPTPGVEMLFRLPVLTLGVAAAVMGTLQVSDWLQRLRTKTTGGSWMAPALAIATAASFALLPGWRSVKAQSAEYLEYRFLEGAVRTLPSPLVLAELRPQEPGPAYLLAHSLFRRGGIDIQREEARELRATDFQGPPVYFLGGIQCRAYSGAELLGQSRGGQSISMRAWYPLLDHEPLPGTVPPDAARPECRRLLEHALPTEPHLTLEHAEPENPFVFYGPSPIDVRFYRLTAPPH